MMVKNRAIILPAYNDNLLRALLALRMEERPLRPLKPGEVLVQMEGTPCNPSDIAFLRGGYNIVKPVPAVPGFEGTGTVVEAGPQAKALLGKRVSCFIQGENDGTWASYFTARSSDCIILKDKMPVEQAACLAINPLTAWGMLEEAEKAGCKALVVNAAGGQVPNILQALAAKKGIQVIRLVRKAHRAEAMKEAGMEHVLDTGDDNFNESLQALCHELNPTRAFDAVAGPLAGRMLNAMPPGSKLVVYGALSGEALGSIDPMGIIFSRKSVEGFNLNDWLAGKSEEEFAGIAGRVQDLVITGEISTRIQGSYPLDKVVDGLRAYIKSMSSGKIIFTP